MIVRHSRPHQHESRWLILMVGIVGLSLVHARAARADSTITISWSPNDPSQKVTGYRFHYATHSGPPYDGKGADQGDSPVDLPTNKLALKEDENHHKYYEAKISGLPPCATIYMAMTAYNAKKEESDYTEEHSTDIPYKLEQLSARALSLDTLRVSWETPPINFRDLIAGYTLFYELSDYPVPDPALHFSSSVVLTPKEFEGKEKPFVLLDGLPQKAWVHLAVAASCPSGTSTLSKVFTTQMPRAGSGPSKTPGENLPTRAVGGCALAPGGASGGSSGPLILFIVMLLAFVRRSRGREHRLGGPR